MMQNKENNQRNIALGNRKGSSLIEVSMVVTLAAILMTICTTILVQSYQQSSQARRRAAFTNQIGRLRVDLIQAINQSDQLVTLTEQKIELKLNNHTQVFEVMADKVHFRELLADKLIRQQDYLIENSRGIFKKQADNPAIVGLHLKPKENTTTGYAVEIEAMLSAAQVLLAAEGDPS